MKLRRAVFVAAAAWLAVVLVGATMTWAVISRAGQELVAGDTQPGALSSKSASPSAPKTTGPDGPLKPRRSAKPDKPKGSRGASAGPSDTPTPSGQDSSPPSTEPSSPDSSTPPAPPPPPPSQPAVRSDTWSGPAGTFTVECRGSDLTNLSAVPNSGWSVKVEREGNRADAHFKQSARDDEVEVHAVCTSRGPVFSDHDGRESRRESRRET
jgi:hypothetical protein